VAIFVASPQTRGVEAWPRTKPITSYFDFLKALLSDRERFFEEVVEGVALRSKLRYAVVTIITLCGFFVSSPALIRVPHRQCQRASRLPFLFFATFRGLLSRVLVVQVLVGSRLRLLQVAVLVFGALALTSVLLAAFVPITAFFLITGANYYFQHLLNIAIAGVAGLFGMYCASRGAQRGVREARRIPAQSPHDHAGVGRVVRLRRHPVGVESAPVLGDRNQPFQIFGRYQGNFYAAIILRSEQAVARRGEADSVAGEARLDPTISRVHHPAIDTVADSTHRRRRR